jgi:hypothetical protein
MILVKMVVSNLDILKKIGINFEVIEVYRLNFSERIENEKFFTISTGSKGELILYKKLYLVAKKSRAVR